MFFNLDRNNDGKVTEEEFRSGFVRAMADCPSLAKEGPDSILKRMNMKAQGQRAKAVTTRPTGA